MDVLLANPRGGCAKLSGVVEQVVLPTPKELASKPGE